MPETRREAREKMDFNGLLHEMYTSKAPNRSQSSEEFKKVEEALRDVVRWQDNIVSRSSAMFVTEAHKRLGEACEAYLNARKGAITGKGKDRLELVEAISNLQKKEADTINAMRDPEKVNEQEKKGKKWGAVIGQSRVTEINVTGKELATVGAGSSTRTVVPLENNRKGFFTPDQIRQNEVDFLQERINTATSENVKEAYKGLLANEHAFFMLSTAAQSSLAENDFDSALSNYIVNPETGKINEGYESTHKAIRWDALSENPADMAEFLKGAKECGKFKTSSEVLEDGGVAIGANMPVRNVASSRLAALLGQGALLAKSELVSLRDGNKIQKGVMMEEAVGMDWNARENRETFGRANDFTDPNLQRQLSTLEVMDYLAGQIDRNIGNMFYRFDKDTPGKLIGIQGIDNDAAFGKFVPGENQYIREFVNIKNIKWIDSDLSMEISGVNSDVLKYTFGDILSSEEIDALDERFENIKNHIRNGLIEPLAPGKWNADTAEKMAQKDGYMKKIITEFDKKKASLQREQKAAQEEGAVQTKTNEPKEKGVPSQKTTVPQETKVKMTTDELGGNQNRKFNFLAAEHRNPNKNNATKAPVAQNMKNPTPTAQKR